MKLAVRLVVIASFGAALGCQSKTSVSGSVTYNGAPVEQGYVTFNPQASGTAFAAPVKDGKYEVAEAKPGTYTVVVVGTKKLDHYSSSAEAYQHAAKNNGHVAEEADYIALDAEGNNQPCEVASGAQTIDFAVTGKPIGQ